MEIILIFDSSLNQIVGNENNMVILGGDLSLPG